MARFKVASVAVILICWHGSHATSQPGATPARLVSPNGLARDGQGSLFVSDIGTHQILKLSPGPSTALRTGPSTARRLTVIAGTGAGGFGGDGGPARHAQLFAPHGIAFDAQGNLLIADTFNHRIRRIDRNGVITTVAGTGTAGYSGDGGPAVASSLNGPQDIAVDRDGNILVADSYNAVVRRIDPAGIITTFAGSEPGLSGDGGLAIKAQINLPTAVAVSSDGAVYLSDAANSRIRRVAPDGTIQTVVGYGAGSGLGGAGFGGDGGPAEKSKAFSAMGLHCDASGTLYISDTGNSRIRVVRNGVISTVAGSGANGFGGDGGHAVAASLNTPQKIVVAPDGRLFIADRGNGRVRVVDTKGVITTIAGGGKPARGSASDVR
jgi:sugar lactone lactonase YvrE